jgi:outer membrane scaffolding protein for murein synthesis (MipA/OmpV family)
MAGPHRNRPRPSVSCGALAVAAGLLGCAPCWAADSTATASPPAPTETPATAPARDAPAPGGTLRPLWELGIGVGCLSVPAYRGSDQRRGYLLPLPYAVYRGDWLRADRDGARALLVDQPWLEVDVSLGATVPVRSKDNDARRGMPDLPGTLEIGPNANIRLAHDDARRIKLELRLPLRAAFSLERSPDSVGATFSPNLNVDIERLAGAWNLGLLTGPLFGDRKHNAFLYDVAAAYATPDRPAYRARGGYEGWRALAATSRRFEDVWFGAFVRYDSLQGAVFEDSPLVRRKSGLSVGFGLSWVLRTSNERVWVRD